MLLLAGQEFLYEQQIVVGDPRDAVRRALAELGRKPKPLVRPSRPDLAKPAVAPEKPAKKQH